MNQPTESAAQRLLREMLRESGENLPDRLTNRTSQPSYEELLKQRDELLEALQQLDKALNAVFLSDSRNKNINSISLKVAINHAQNIIAKVSK